MARATVAALAADLAAGRTTSKKLVEQAFARIEDTAGEGKRAFLKLYKESAQLEADTSDRLRSMGVVRSPVDGIPISLKDLFDVSGDVTKAGSTVLASNAPAEADAPAVARLRAAGAIIVGKTNMVEFAFGGTGVNSHYGIPKNPFDRETGRIPGGSSSGAAVSVTDGMCCMGLGTDTRGSARIPAALCGLTGFKPTASRIPRDGAFPLSYSLDSVGPLANSVACCAVYDAILAGGECSKVSAPDALPLPGLRFLVPRCSLLDGLDATVDAAFKRAIQVLKDAGVNIVEQDAKMLTDAQGWFKGGGLAGAESFHVHQSLFPDRKAEYDPRVSARIGLGGSFTAAQYIQMGTDRSAIIKEAQALLKPFDAMLFPTSPIIAPTIQETEKSDEDYVKVNLTLLRNPGIVNLLDGCAASVPCHAPGEAPVGLSVAGMGGTDTHILAVARSVEQALKSVVAGENGGDDCGEPARKKSRL